MDSGVLDTVVASASAGGGCFCRSYELRYDEQGCVLLKNSKWRNSLLEGIQAKCGQGRTWDSRYWSDLC